MIIPRSEQPEQQLLTTSTTAATTTSASASAIAPWKMPNWYFDKKELKNTPSIRDGLDFETDRRYRREGARFIMECGTKMGLGHNTMATGVVYFHRFYVFHSFKSFPRYVTACCCLFLAGKVEETPKKCRDIIKWARSMLSDQKFASFGDDAKEEVMTLERILLQTIKFDLQVEHPYSYLVKYAKCLKGDQKQLGKMVQMAWNFVNDSLSTTVCLQWEPEIIAVALIHLASKLSKFSVTKWDGQLPTHLRWWDMFVADVTMEILEDICHQVLDLYQEPNQMDADSPPQLPPSKSSPPMKRGDKVSPVYAKTSPAGAGGAALSAAVGQPVQVIGGGQSIAAIPPLPHGQPLQHQLPPQQQQQQHHHHAMATQHGGHHHSQQHSHKASIEEKLQNMPSAAMHQRNNSGLMDSMGYGGGHHGGYGAQPTAAAYGTMFQHSQFGGGGGQAAVVGQPPLPPQPSQQQHQQQSSGMYSGGGNSNAYGGGQQQIPAHYQSGGGGGGSQGYYQQPPQSGRGGYYQGPP